MGRTDGRGRIAGMGRRGWMGGTGWMGRTGGTGRGRMGRIATTVLIAAAFFMSSRVVYPSALAYLAGPARPAYAAPPALPAQIPFEQAAKNLTSADPATRLRAVQLLKETT